MDDTLLGFNLHVSWGVPRSGPHVDFFSGTHLPARAHHHWAAGSLQRDSYGGPVLKRCAHGWAGTPQGSSRLPGPDRRDEEEECDGRRSDVDQAMDVPWATLLMMRQDQTRLIQRKRKLVEPGLDNTCLFKRV